MLTLRHRRWVSWVSAATISGFMLCTGLAGLTHARSSHLSSEPSGDEVSGRALRRADISADKPAYRSDRLGSGRLAEGVWEPTNGPWVEGGQVNAIATDPAASGIVFAAVAPLGAFDTGPSLIFVSTDAGANWTQVHRTKGQVYSLAVRGQHVYAGTFSPAGQGPGVYVSRDRGSTWDETLPFAVRGVWSAIAIDPSDPQVAVVGGMRLEGPASGALLYRTADAGARWEPVYVRQFGDRSGSIGALVVHHTVPGLMIAALHSENRPGTELLRSEDGGLTWKTAGRIHNRHVLSLVAGPGETSFLAGTGESAFTWGSTSVFRSEDAGATWTAVSSDAGGRLAFAAPTTVYALDGLQLWRSSSSGDADSWQPVGRLAEDGASLAIDATSSPLRLYAGGTTAGVMSSVDGGAQWQTMNRGLRTGARPNGIAVAPDDVRKVAAATLDAGAWFSTDAGASWSPSTGASKSMSAIGFDPADSQRVYGGAQVCDQGAIVLSTDGGRSFSAVHTASFVRGDCSGGEQAIESIGASRAAPGLVMAVGSNRPGWETRQAVVLRSTDSGSTWEEVLTLPPESSLEALALHPWYELRAIAGGESCTTTGCTGCVYLTTDQGQSWEQVASPSAGVTTISYNHQDSRVAYFTTATGEIWQTHDGGTRWSLMRQPEAGGRDLARLLVVDPRVPSFLYIAGPGFVGESFDGGSTWSEAGGDLSKGVPAIAPRALVIDGGEQVQTLYGGYSRVWRFGRPAPQPGEPMTVTVTPGRARISAGGNVSVAADIRDEFRNWVADGTEVTFVSSPEGSFGPGSDPLVVEALNGRADATLKALLRGTAAITVHAGAVFGTAEVLIGGGEIYLPLLEVRR